MGGRKPNQVSAAGDSPDKVGVGRSFGNAAGRYDRLAALQRGVADDLLVQLAGMGKVPSHAVDVGAGTGYCARWLRLRYPAADLTVLDLAPAMLRQARQRPELRRGVRFLCGDAERLPLRSASADLLVSNLALQWCVDLAAALAELRRVIAPGGLAAISLFSGDTLSELRAAWSRVDRYSHVNRFVTADQLADLLSGCGWGSYTLTESVQVPSYPGVDQLLRELKGWGAGNVTRNRPRHLTGKAKLAAMVRAYETAMAEGKVRATFRVAMVIAQA
ncbi:MAG: malonyl-ACP O-methyltransferase BioC [Methylococcaceae bacterium]|nr:malonyl-ACP O-methyltransferase BioC [Methylococcaceae bacterium]